MRSNWSCKDARRWPKPCALAISSRNKVPFFAYKARNARGELMQGVLEGADSGAVADQLFGTGVTPVEIVATTRAVSAVDGELSAWEKFTEKKVTAIDVQLFSRQMYTLIKSGVPLMRG